MKHSARIAGTRYTLIYAPGRIRHVPIIWWDSEVWAFISFALLLYHHFNNPASMHLCCGIEEAWDSVPIDFDRLRGWIVEHPDVVFTLASYRIEKA